MENVAIKGRVKNDVQHKNWKGKILRIQTAIIRHGGLGHEVQESWPYLSNATPQPYELSHVKNEFSLVRLTACQSMRMVRVREKVFRNSSGFRFNVSFVDCTSVFVYHSFSIKTDTSYQVVSPPSSPQRWLVSFPRQGLTPGLPSPPQASPLMTNFSASSPGLSQERELGIGSSNCCIFEMKHATGMETCTKIYFLFIFNLV